MQTDVCLVLSGRSQSLLGTGNLGRCDKGLGNVSIAGTDLVNSVSEGTADGLIIHGSTS